MARVPDLTIRASDRLISAPLVAVCGDDEHGTVTCRVEKLLAQADDWIEMDKAKGRATRSGGEQAR